jgi:large conductance mechanosensitive channel
MLTEYRQFILRGNVVDLAVAVVIGAAFGAVITSLVTNILTPIVAAIFGQPDFSALSFTLNGSEVLYGAFLNSVIGFLIIVTAIFFLVVKPINAAMNRMRTEPTPDPLTGKCPFCLSEIQVGATRCAFCTQEIEPVAPDNR